MLSADLGFIPTMCDCKLITYRPNLHPRSPRPNFSSRPLRVGIHPRKSRRKTRFLSIGVASPASRPLSRRSSIIIFPTANGKTWTDVLDADEARQVGTDRRDVTVWLRPAGNLAELTDHGDYYLHYNAILDVRYSSCSGDTGTRCHEGQTINE